MQESRRGQGEKEGAVLLKVGAPLAVALLTLGRPVGQATSKG